MKTLLDLENWNRKEHFLFFKQMEEPFFGVTTKVDCTKAYANAKKLGVSFFTYYLHKTLTAVNQCEPFRYRIIDNEIYIFDQIDVSSTILREDKTFGFSQIEYSKDLNQFAENTKNEIARIQSTPGLFTREYSENLISLSNRIPYVSRRDI